jgi:hypothetical protein
MRRGEDIMTGLLLAVLIVTSGSGLSYASGPAFDSLTLTVPSSLVEQAKNDSLAIKPQAVRLAPQKSQSGKGLERHDSGATWTDRNACLDAMIWMAGYLQSVGCIIIDNQIYNSGDHYGFKITYHSANTSDTGAYDKYDSGAKWTDRSACLDAMTWMLSSLRSTGCVIIDNQIYTSGGLSGFKITYYNPNSSRTKTNDKMAQ